MALQPHYTRTGTEPAVVGAGDGAFRCAGCGAVLIAGYDPRNFLGIEIGCAACGQVSATPGLADDEAPPSRPLTIERGATGAPSEIGAGTVLIGREEAERISRVLLPRRTEEDVHALDAALLDEVDARQRAWTGESLDPEGASFRRRPLAWAVGHLRARLGQAAWVGLADDADMVAMTAVASFRDLIASWGHHPLFPAMARTVAADGFSLHAQARFAAAKALALGGNRIVCVATEGPSPAIRAIRLSVDGGLPIGLHLHRFDRFEFPGAAGATPAAVSREVVEAMDASRGQINRNNPGLLVLSPGASVAEVDRMVYEAAGAALAAHGKRYRGLAAVALIVPKIAPGGTPREVRLGYRFHPLPNPRQELGRTVQVGSRADFNR